MFSSSSPPLLPWKIRFMQSRTSRGNGLHTKASHLAASKVFPSCFPDDIDDLARHPGGINALDKAMEGVLQRRLAHSFLNVSVDPEAITAPWRSISRWEQTRSTTSRT